MPKDVLMHPQAMSYVEQFKTDAEIRVLDIGGRDVNGTPRHLFPYARYKVIDKLPGDNVNIVADATVCHPSWRGQFDLVLCLEVFEHTPYWASLCGTAYQALRPSGLFVMTCAGPGRLAHSAITGDLLSEDHDEFYQNIGTGLLSRVLSSCGFVNIEARTTGEDTQANAEKP